MKTRYKLISVTLALTLAIILSNFGMVSATQWGIETGVKYKFTLKKFYMGGDLTPFLKENATLEIVFTSLNETGYSYNVYNRTDLVAEELSTVFVETETCVGNFTLPVGLPIALPLSIGAHANYMEELGTFVNESATYIPTILSEQELNLTEIGENVTIGLYSTIDSETFSINVDVYSPKLNSTLLELLNEAVSSEDLPLTIPTNITDFTMNVTLSYSVTTGLFSNLLLRIRSKTIQYGYSTNFNVDVEYGTEVKQTTTTTSSTTQTTQTEPTPLLIASGITSLIGISMLKLVRKKRKI